MADLKRLQEADKLIQEICCEWNLDFFPQEFDVIPAQKMLEIMAYHFPINFSHWSFGRDYEAERTKYEHGFGIPYEVVFNSNPSRAYLMSTNPTAIQILVMAHVYAHNNFMKNNRLFAPTRRDMLHFASSSFESLRKYEEDWGENVVEQIVDAALAIQFNLDPYILIEKEDEESARERMIRESVKKRAGIQQIKSRYGDLVDFSVNPEEIKKMRKEEYKMKRKTPLDPELDIIGYIMAHSPKALDDWEINVLSVIRKQGVYFIPQMKTKIMNEGWATYWHQKIMAELLRRGFLTDEDHGLYNLYNSRVIAFNKKQLNPYLVGSKIFADIKHRWDAGRHGKEWEECNDPQKMENWDTKEGLGDKKIFEVRNAYADRSFIDDFLTADLVDKLEMYIYKMTQESDKIKWVIAERDWRKIKSMLVRLLTGFGAPIIKVEDGNYEKRSELFLKHYFDGVPLDPEYREKTMEHIFFLWDRPVHLETTAVAEEQPLKRKKIIYSFDGKDFKEEYKEFVNVSK